MPGSHCWERWGEHGGGVPGSGHLGPATSSGGQWGRVVERSGSSGVTDWWGGPKGGGPDAWVLCQAVTPAPPPPLYGTGMAEELAKKLQLRRALTGDRWVPAWRGGQPGCPPLCARNQLGQQCPPLPRAKLSLVPPGPGTRSGLGWHWGGVCRQHSLGGGSNRPPTHIFGEHHPRHHPQ